MGSSDGEILDEWLQSALAGARAAIEFGCPGSGLDVVEFTEFRGCLADTSNSAAWCAAAMAALCALDLPNAKPVYDIDKGRWAVELPSGEMLEMR